MQTRLFKNEIVKNIKDKKGEIVMANEKIVIVYSEPAEYIPEELRREYKLGEFAEASDENQGTNKKGTVGMKMPDDEELEKLFESLDRKTARLIDNQHTPTKRTVKKSIKTDVDCGGIKPIDPIKPPKK